MGNAPLVIEQILPATVDAVWKAISDRDAMKQWYFDLKEFKPEVGFEFQFEAGPSDGRQYLHICKITELIVGKKLAYSWQYGGYDGDSLVTFELFDEGNQTRLKLTHAGLESFPVYIPDFSPQSFAEGWTYLIGPALKEYLGKTA